MRLYKCTGRKDGKYLTCVESHPCRLLLPKTCEPGVCPFNGEEVEWAEEKIIDFLPALKSRISEKIKECESAIRDDAGNAEYWIVRKKTLEEVRGVA